MEKDIFRRRAALLVLFLLVVLISGCCGIRQSYQAAGVQYPLADWPDYTQDKDVQWNLLGNRGIGSGGYFYPMPGEVEPEEAEVVEKETPPQPVVQKIEPKPVEPKPVVEKKIEPIKVEPTPEVKKKVEGEKEWCPRKKRTVIPAEPRVVVADFDSGTKPNNMGYDFGAWNRDPNDYSQTCIESFTRITRDGRGFSLQIYYDVDSPISAYNGFWCKLDGDIDYSVFKKVEFWVKGDPDKGYTKVFKVELKNCINETAIYYFTNVTDEWQYIVIPFEKFKGLSEWSLLKEFVITFEDRIATKKEGAIYIDDVAFLKE